MRPSRTVIVGLEKLRNYCLSEVHPRGRHKAHVFRSRLGLTADDAELLQRALLDAVRDRHRGLRHSAHDRYGRRYLLDFEMTTHSGTAFIRLTWIVRPGEAALRFITCYVQ
jgi:hypothetical protein